MDGSSDVHIILNVDAQHSHRYKAQFPSYGPVLYSFYSTLALKFTNHFLFTLVKCYNRNRCYCEVLTYTIDDI